MPRGCATHATHEKDDVDKMGSLVPSEVTTRVITQIERLREAYKRAMQWEWCGGEPPPTVPWLSSYRSHSPDGKAFMFIAQAEALTAFLTHGDLAKAIECGRREWRDYVSTHNKRIKERGWCKGSGDPNVACSNDQWSDEQDAELIYWCSTDTERAARREANDHERRQRRAENITTEDYLSESETRVELADKDVLLHRVSQDYLRRLIGVPDADCGNDAVWCVETQKRGKDHHLFHIGSGMAWTIPDATIDDLVHFALAHSTEVVALMTDDAVDSMLTALCLWLEEKEAA